MHFFILQKYILFGYILSTFFLHYLEKATTYKKQTTDFLIITEKIVQNQSKD